MKLTTKLIVLAPLILMGCAGFNPFERSKNQISQTGEVINAINYFTEDGTESWMIDCTQKRSLCIKRASEICDGAYDASFIDQDNPMKNLVELTPEVETIPRSRKDTFTMSASCGVA